MIIKQNEMSTEIRPNMRGGNGNIKITNIVNKEDLKNARLLAYINIPVNASIGDHEHKDETEYYIILKGKGQVIDDGKMKTVTEGDVVITGGGASHSIENIGDIELKMIAIIITY
jgi:mannose-6-phosphate isomerase-like protein (cupin superfamily)